MSDTTKARVVAARAEVFRCLAGCCSFGLRHTLLDEFETAVREDERAGDAFRPPLPGAVA